MAQNSGNPMISDRRARKLFILCDKLGIKGVQKYIEDGRFGAEKLPLLNVWLDLQIQRAEEEQKKIFERAKREEEALAKPVKKVKKAKKSK